MIYKIIGTKTIQGIENENKTIIIKNQEDQTLLSIPAVNITEICSPAPSKLLVKTKTQKYELDNIYDCGRKLRDMIFIECVSAGNKNVVRIV